MKLHKKVRMTSTQRYFFAKDCFLKPIFAQSSTAKVILVLYLILLTLNNFGMAVFFLLLDSNH